MHPKVGQDQWLSRNHCWRWNHNPRAVFVNYDFGTDTSRRHRNASAGENAPFTLGANLAPLAPTLASLVIGTDAAVQIALCHLFQYFWNLAVVSCADSAPDTACSG